MKKITIQCILAVAVLTCMLLAGCSSGGSSGDTSDRLAALEAGVEKLKAETKVRDDALREELALVRKNLESIRSLLEAGQGGTAVKPEAGSGSSPELEGDALDEAIDTKAKTFVKENLDRLLAITKKLLDKMELELDRQMEKDTQPAPPEGDKI
ncbi:hypothetical protein [uncultured Pseudodesulfovibrio sp.]|uniref:hypothetical protein n=1 Tax=uncultured Pseudodesulfovibrio sp. TaxID=2035858 RepID=UPI0029C6F656|nr:hypothetical protein [uncultured Pseudodesulfovibrio sp.]